jgi:hypothetical protein
MENIGVVVDSDKDHVYGCDYYPETGHIDFAKCYSFSGEEHYGSVFRYYYKKNGIIRATPEQEKILMESMRAKKHLYEAKVEEEPVRIRVAGNNLVPKVISRLARPPYSETSPLDDSQYWCQAFFDLSIKITETKQDKAWSRGFVPGSVIVAGERSIDMVGKIIDPYQRVIIKMSYPPLPNDNSLSYEGYVYEKIVPILMIRTPHLVKGVANLTCKKLPIYISALSTPETLEQIEKGKLYRRRDLTDDDRKIYKTTYERLRRVGGNYVFRSGLQKTSDEPILFNDIPIHVSITERSSGITLYDFVTTDRYFNHSKNQKDRFNRDIGIQVAHTLNVMAKERLLHNDLHIRNIYLEEKSEKEELPYLVDGKKFWSKYFVKIFDWDRASLDGNPVNAITAPDGWACVEHGECDKFIENMDWFCFLDTYLNIVKDSILLEYFPEKSKYPSDEKFGGKDQRSHRGRICICDADGCKKCTVDTRLLERLLSLDEFLSSIYQNYPDESFLEGSSFFDVSEELES